jgi:hypothetical protein
MKHEIDECGDECWYDDNLDFHREDGPAIIWKNGNKTWIRHGRLHRKNGPAAEYVNGDSCWYVNDRLHRLDGPAMDSKYRKEWYIDGEQIYCKDNEEFLRIIKMKELL